MLGLGLECFLGVKSGIKVGIAAVVGIKFGIVGNAVRSGCWVLHALRSK